MRPRATGGADGRAVHSDSLFTGAAPVHGSAGGNDGGPTANRGDRRGRRLAAEGQSSQPGQTVAGIADLLVLRPGALGDTLLTVPALRLLRRQYPGARIALAAHGAAARFLADLGEVDQAMPFDDPRLAWIFGSRTDPWEPPELVLGWLSDSGSDLAARLRSAGVRRVSLHPSRPPPTSGEHQAAYLARTAAGGDSPAELDISPLRVVPETSDEVLLHPGSGSARKNWPAARFADVVRRLQALGVPLRVVEGDADEHAAEAVRRCAGGPVASLRRPDLAGLAARLAGCRGYLGNDSGVTHLAGLCGARTFALFGPTDPATWAPLGPAARALPFDTAPDEVVRLLLAPYPRVGARGA